MVYVFLGEGFEEIEALAPVDVMRRAGLDTAIVGVTGKEVVGSHGIKVTADLTVEKVCVEKAQALVLPGGMPGTLHLEQSEAVRDLLEQGRKQGILLAAICAAPSILAHRGWLSGKEATAFPDFQKDLEEGGAKLSKDYVCRDGFFLTARGMGVSIPFGLALVEALVSKEKAEEIKTAIQWEV